MKPAEKRSFVALLFTQFWGAFNDNLLKVLVQLLVVQWVFDALARQQLVNLATTVFDLPFLLFSMLAGRISDRYSKPDVIRGVQIWQILVVVVAAISILKQNIPAMMGSLALLAMQATFFSPAKYGVLPELMGESELSDGNGILNMATFVAILAGTVVGSFLTGHLGVACALLVFGGVAGLVGSFFIKPLPPARPTMEFGRQPYWLVLCTINLLALVWFLMRAKHGKHVPHMVEISLMAGVLVWFLLANGSDLWQNWKIIRGDRQLKLGMIAVNYFWFLGGLLLTNLFIYAKEMMHVDARVSGFLLVSLTVGIAIGSFAAGRWSKGKVELGLVPIGAFGMSLLTIDMLWAWHSLIRTLVDLFFIGFFAGLYEIPLNALIQWRSPKEHRGRVLATQNFISFLAILGASGALWLLGSRLNFDPAEVLFILGIVSLMASIIVYTVIPDAMWRFVLYVLTSIFYNIRIVGGERVPTRGPALLVANHLSMVDGFLVGAAIPRLVRFLMWKPYYEAKPWHWLMRTVKAIPISEKDPPKEILKSLLVARKALEEGHLVCLFAEGQVSRTGNLLEFKRGFEVIVKGLDVPVIPVNLDRVWGSIFSFEHGSVIYKRPRRIPYPVTITFGEPLKPPVTPAVVRQAVLDLGVEAFRLRLEDMGSLPIEFLKRAKRQPSALAVADSSGRKLSFATLAASAAEFGRLLKQILTPEKNVGLLLPSSVVGALTNVALALIGRVAVNLNYTVSSTALDVAVKKADITRILTSRKLLEKTGLPVSDKMLFVEDLIPCLSKTRIGLNSVLLRILPMGWMLRRLGPDAATSLQDTVTIMFSSGSTGIPKGVVLSHANVLSNILGLQQVFDLGPKDSMLGILPFFHSFGFTGTLWFPLIAGFGGIYHSNPLDAKTVGELVARYKATMLLATPTFLLAYTRKCTPEQFKTLRFVITGAERLQEPIAKAFEEKFGRTPLEGYGCTELSPVATVNVPDVSMGEINQIGHKAGKVGHPIPGVSVKVVNPETFEPMPQGEKGLLIVKGSNVMQGYLNDADRTAEVIRDGWYITGDLAMIDADGFVQILDRLSRFSKIGGEMVPHMMIEERLNALAGRIEPTFAVSEAPDPKRGEQLVVLYTPFEGSMDDVWEKLNESDLPKLWVPARENFFEIEKLPYLGTGKLDLAALRKLSLEKIKKP